MAGQGLAVNVYSNPNDGAGGQWEFSPLENYGSTETPVTFDYLVEGKAYTFNNAVEGFEGLALADDNQGNNLKASADLYANNAWIAESVTTNTDGSQTLKLKNAVTGRYITDLGNFQSRVGSAANVGASQAEANVTLSLNAKYNDLRVKVAGKSLFPSPQDKLMQVALFRMVLMLLATKVANGPFNRLTSLHLLVWTTWVVHLALTHAAFPQV